MGCDNCLGRCCDPVVLGTSPQSIVEAYINSKVGTKKVNNPKEVEKMYKNLTFKGVSTFSPMEKGVYADGTHLFMYECNNFDYENRKCKDYENRMDFCREYGDDNECGYN
jgi:Fe-S-cluster containining protein